MIIVGLTGGIASGKSTVAKMLEEKGAVVFDTDVIAREVVDIGQPAWHEILEYFGEDVKLKDGLIDRKKLGDLVFNDAEARHKLNSIVHPRVMEKLVEDTEELKKKSQPPEIVVYDVPLLIEAGMNKMVDIVVLVFSSIQAQKERLKKRDGFLEEEIEARLSSQMPTEEKKKYADYIIDNSSDLEETNRQVEELWSILPLVDMKKVKK